jgi:transketolase
VLHNGFGEPLSSEDLKELQRRAHHARGTVLTATTLAASGHPGGSFSSMELYTLLYSCARLRSSDPHWGDRDRVVVSHGHTSPGVYSALAEANFFPAEQVAAHFRQAGSIFEGHVERSVPGVEWSTGNLGQGLSAGVGLALGARMTGASWHTFVAMSDGEQQKGQVGEARRLAAKYGLGNVTAIVDWNGIQISGATSEVMPVPLVADWAADGWRVFECDGHDLTALHEAIAHAASDALPSVVLAHTVIGKGVSFMEGEAEFHGRGLTAEEYAAAMSELGLDAAALELARAARAGTCTVERIDCTTRALPLVSGAPRTYEPGSKSDNRSAWGAALVDLATANPQVALAVLDCDLAASVKTAAFASAHPERFVECGVGEHNTATVAGALSTVPGVVAFWADFGVFGIDEVYNQQRLNDINRAALKLVVTHCGLDVGEDGRTHHCLDYVGSLRGLFGWRVIVPADPNQTDRAVRAAASMQGNVAIAMGRSVLPVIEDMNGDPLFGRDYEFGFGRIDWARQGSAATILTMGTVAGAAVVASDMLRRQGVEVAVGIVATPLELADEALHTATAAPLVLTAEDHCARTGLGASVAEWMAAHPTGARLVRVGVEGYRSSGLSSELLAREGLDAESLAKRVLAELQASDVR